MRIRFPLLPRWLRWAGVLAVAGTIVYLSLITVPPKPAEPGPLWDKKMHFLAYGALGLSLLYATARFRDYPLRRAIIVVLAVGAFGALIEILQGRLPYRYMSLWDGVANLLGGLLALVWLAVERHLRYRRVPAS